MAERRMFAKTIIDSDAFLDMPMSARLLYYDLGMRADDDGFVNAPKKIMRLTGASQNDLDLLMLKSFLLPFNSGVVVITHWRIHNYIRKDTYKETQYLSEKSTLELDRNNTYRFKDKSIKTELCEPSTKRIQYVDEPSTQVRLGKDSIDKDSVEEEVYNARTHTHACEKVSTATATASKFSLPISSTESIFLSEVFINHLKSRYPNLDIEKEFTNISLKLVASGYPCKTLLSLQSYVVTWFNHLTPEEIEKSSKLQKIDNKFDVEKINEKMRKMTFEDI